MRIFTARYRDRSSRRSSTGWLPSGAGVAGSPPRASTASAIAIQTLTPSNTRVSNREGNRSEWGKQWWELENLGIGSGVEGKEEEEEEEGWVFEVDRFAA